MMTFQSAEPGAKLLERQTKLCALTGESNSVGAILGFHDDDILEAVANPRDRPLEMRVLDRQVNHDNALWSQAAMAIVVEALSAQLRGLTVQVEPIHEQNIDRIDDIAHKGGTVLAKYLEVLIVPWNTKQVPQSHDIGVDFC